MWRRYWQDDVVHQLAYDAKHKVGMPLCETYDHDQRAWLGSIDGVTCDECLRQFSIIELI